jgi:hypothetical protein
MTCLSCEDRARLLKELKDAFDSGDRQCQMRIMKELFGTVVTDFSKLKSITFKTKVGAVTNPPISPQPESIASAEMVQFIMRDE